MPAGSLILAAWASGSGPLRLVILCLAARTVTGRDGNTSCQLRAGDLRSLLAVRA